MDALSTSVEAEFSPNVADAEKGSASITIAMLASNSIELKRCVFWGAVIRDSKQWFDCMSFLLSDSPRLSGMGRLSLIILHASPAGVDRWARNDVKSMTTIVLASERGPELRG